MHQKGQPVKKNNPILTSKPTLLTIRGKAPFTTTLKRIRESKKIDFVWVKNPNPEQMSAVIVARLLGKKFFWVQEFYNPPTANFLSKFLMINADKILVKNKEDFFKLKKFGIEKTKIRFVKDIN